ncbi:MAG TPA: CDP-archaeol synthase [Sedimenticola sp.]|nr:CDP-archaeol synthase [Sedimenticola sp.]
MIANGTPVIARKLFGSRFGFPLDGGVKFMDGRPLLGSSKTLRGLLLAVVAATLTAPLFGYCWGIGAMIGGAAMLGDLLSSFIKRRLGLAPSSMALGLDQIPESLLPLLVCKVPLGLGWLSIAMVTMAFFVCELLFSFVLYRLHIRRRPY